MKKLTLLIVLLSFCTSLWADKIRFTSFTVKSGYKGVPTNFKIKLLRNHRLKPDVNIYKELKCWAYPKNSNYTYSFSCNINGDTLNFYNMKQILKSSFKDCYDEFDIKKANKVGTNTYQVVDADDVYHIRFKMPVVRDDTINCMFSVLEEKKLAHMICKNVVVKCQRDCKSNTLFSEKNIKGFEYSEGPSKPWSLKLLKKKKEDVNIYFGIVNREFSEKFVRWIIKRRKSTSLSEDKLKEVFSKKHYKDMLIYFNESHLKVEIRYNKMAMVQENHWADPEKKLKQFEEYLIIKLSDAWSYQRGDIDSKEQR